MIIAIDTSGGDLVVSLLDQGLQLSASRIVPGRRHQDSILGALQELVGDAHTVAGLAGIAVVRGPGSQTGIRVGLSTAQGMAFGARVPLLALNSLEVAAARVTSPRPLVALVSAGRTNVYAQHVGAEGALQGARRLVALTELASDTDWIDGREVVGEAALMAQVMGLGPALASPLRGSDEALAAAVRTALQGGVQLAYHQLTGDYGES
ncbi:MAG: tRNA (adenosine(37)-N6)-threonylcarbamoyltransferase complex dimerization subunit type 1 TsaB [Candidatus Dormibacteria bacterium]